MSDIKITDLTNKTTGAVGTGVFDVIAESVKLHLQEEFSEGKITGAEYATVYLGALQSTLQQSMTFLLSEQEASKKIELLEQQILEAQERIDLVIAQTAKAYEDIDASRAKTARDNVLSTKQVLKLQKETLLVAAQIAEQEYTTNFLRPAQLAKLLSETTNNTNESVQKVLLMAAQTLGFASDTKQKVLKQMMDGFAVGLSIAGVGNIPEANQDEAIDQLTQEILQDLNSAVIIQTGDVDPATGLQNPTDGETAPPAQ